jgi:peptidoglycan/xylan/chitin deacetylase (PgdA/CDA1 family)
MRNKIFYLLKPLIPRNIQLYLRRKIVQRAIPKCKNVWPILKGSEKKPDNWAGWPDNKKFAVILTHDVEHQKGYGRVLNLMNIEKNLGFVSSFNFVPERDYKVEMKLLNKLKENGFEFGVHGLHHDGKLFSSENEFLNRAKKINNYMKDWGAVGFRAPAMHHNLDWMGELNIIYDLSTFDTDPFEPQPDGVNTIFPFWVDNKRHSSGGFLEIPYTMAQDSTLFLIMKEQTIKIWQEKLDWIAQNGGMALLNVHPDYITFNGTPEEYEFPIKIYESFLRYLSERYNNQFWNVTPKELAFYWSQLPEKNQLD